LFDWKANRRLRWLTVPAWVGTASSAVGEAQQFAIDADATASVGTVRFAAS
jgi:hypothetical protein